MDLSGIWLGPCFSNIFLAIGYNVLIARINWRSLILDAQERAEEEKRLRDEKSNMEN